jgi:predicted nuclease with RNAse H fold
MRDEARAVGIDVSADGAWAVALELAEHPRVIATRLLDPGSPEALERFAAGATAVAIDAPGGHSGLCHLGDERLAPKFQRARCSEVALARSGIAVPFVTPGEGAELPGWMATGLSLWKVLEGLGHAPLETYPHGAFWRLAGYPLLHKQRPAGHRRRLELLGRSVELPRDAEMWCHDAVDALVCAVVAWHASRGTAASIDCSADGEWPTHDGSAIWLPPLSEDAALSAS